MPFQHFLCVWLKRLSLAVGKHLLQEEQQCRRNV